MSEFDINLSGMSERQTELNRIYGKLLISTSRIESCRNVLSQSMSSDALQSVSRNLKSLSSSLVNQAGHIRKFSSGLRQITNSYIRAEKELVGEAEAIPVEQVEAAKSFWDKLVSGDEIKGSVASGDLTGAATLLGVEAVGTVGGSVLGYEIESKTTGFGMEFKDGKLRDMGLNLGLTAEGYVAEGHLQGEYGVLSGELSGKVLDGSVKGEIGASLFNDGKLSPQIYGKAEAEVSALSGEAKLQIGGDENNIHAKADGTVFGAEADARIGAGMIPVKGKDGQEHLQPGVEMSAGAEAYVFKGEVSGGLNIFGVDIDIGLEGKAFGVGANAGYTVTGSSAEGEIGGSLFLGGTIKFKIDWSGFKFPWQ